MKTNNMMQILERKRVIMKLICHIFSITFLCGFICFLLCGCGNAPTNEKLNNKSEDENKAATKESDETVVVGNESSNMPDKPADSVNTSVKKLEEIDNTLYEGKTINEWLLLSKDDMSKGYAVLKRIGDPAIPSLINALNTDDTRLCVRAACFILYELGNTRLLIDFLKDKNRTDTGREIAAMYLSAVNIAIKDKDIVKDVMRDIIPVYIDIIREKKNSMSLRMSVRQSFARLDFDLYVSSCIDLMNEKDEGLRKQGRSKLVFLYKYLEGTDDSFGYDAEKWREWWAANKARIQQIK